MELDVEDYLSNKEKGIFFFHGRAGGREDVPQVGLCFPMEVALGYGMRLSWRDILKESLNK